MKKTIIILSVFFLLLITGFLVLIVPKMTPPSQLPVLGNPGHLTGKFSFTDQRGNTITEQTVAGKVRVVEYFFTTCKGICPKMNANMRYVYDAYLHDPKVVILSHTVDPETDSVATMAAYAKKFNADPAHWMFLTGSKKALYAVAREQYLLSADEATPKDTAGDFIHTQYFALVDGENRIRGFYDGTNRGEVNQLISDIKTLE
ncbi:protein SCO1/2 [Chitinophaga costaii]|uniref:Protein SCO1/2 n=1 Tax=Chitinophaga costaii TaxID=1335309 RepID=A0A1C4FZC4_9BACT|nr:SCO family protein [Chitinophaga costaii]PUZ20953.1 SCO family protein [Chitinophaga costaii]SCC61307.1 protein SCO1/2 [Chitinophaga costaii]